MTSPPNGFPPLPPDISAPDAQRIAYQVNPDSDLSQLDRRGATLQTYLSDVRRNLKETQLGLLELNDKSDNHFREIGHHIDISLNGVKDILVSEFGLQLSRLQSSTQNALQSITHHYVDLGGRMSDLESEMQGMNDSMLDLKAQMSTLRGEVRQNLGNLGDRIGSLERALGDTPARPHFIAEDGPPRPTAGPSSASQVGIATHTRARNTSMSLPSVPSFALPLALPVPLRLGQFPGNLPFSSNYPQQQQQGMGFETPPVDFTALFQVTGLSERDFLNCTSALRTMNAILNPLRQGETFSPPMHDVQSLFTAHQTVLNFTTKLCSTPGLPMEVVQVLSELPETLHWLNRLFVSLQKTTTSHDPTISAWFKGL